jgi:hypothetical protein
VSDDVRRIVWEDGSVHHCTCKGASEYVYVVEPDCIAHEYVWKGDSFGTFREKTDAAKRGNA